MHVRREQLLGKGESEVSGGSGIPQRTLKGPGAGSKWREQAENRVQRNPNNWEQRNVKTFRELGVSKGYLRERKRNCTEGSERGKAANSKGSGGGESWCWCGGHCGQ